ncbi:hypothetical protein EVAR_8022_1 [Eumeta japonica]|uniref:Uncharacterized protein n=1 Tax=Eumeta variegata TaxID=151549 RepID=A0A4C1THX6_EUMVA|nr:hypothetical protein EVAR_8022_1 [Eumeta japonica]
MRSLRSMCRVSRKDRCRNSDVKQRCRLKEDVVTRVERGILRWFDHLERIRAYTMKELKGIVEYIKDRKAYGETKGRKMWVDYANSGNTTRTWQSLKETFLKRILPDIHNPYYRLTSDELRSFRAGSNLTKSNRKLEVHSSDAPEVPDHTDTTVINARPDCKRGRDRIAGRAARYGTVPTDQEEKPKKAIPNYNGEVGKATGEKPNVKNTDVRRDSVETVILDSNEPCYSSAQDIIRDLETPTEKKPVNSLLSSKSIRDVFTYSEPLTPMIQEIFNDFETDESNALHTKLSDHDNNSSLNVQDAIDHNNDSKHNESDKNKSKSLQKKNKKSHKKQKPAQNMRIVNTLEEVKSILNENRNSKESDAVAEKINDINSSNQNDGQSKNPDSLKEVNSLTVYNSQNCHNTGFTDSSIPNNQEALNINKYSKGSEILELSSESDLNKPVKNPIAKTKSKRTISNNSEEKSSRKIRKNIKNVSVDIHTENEYKNQTENNNTTLTEQEQVPEAENKKLQLNEEQDVEPVVKIINNAINANDDINNQNVNNYVSVEKPDITKISHDQTISEKPKENIHNNDSQITNPCLESASLYLGGKVEPNFTQNGIKCSLENNVVLLNSHSDSDTSNSLKISQRKRKRENSKALAKVFGFSNVWIPVAENGALPLVSGVCEFDALVLRHLVCLGPTSYFRFVMRFPFVSAIPGAGNHKTETRVVNSTMSDTNDYTESISSDSSCWTSDNEIEFVASPHKHRRSRKYLNPGSCKIVPLEHDGGLVVAYKGRVYPLIKEERSIKGRELKYMLYARNKNKDDNASYWRKKYFEEKKKAQELSSNWTTRGGADGARHALGDSLRESSRHRMSLETDTGRFHIFYPARKRQGGIRDLKAMT